MIQAPSLLCCLPPQAPAWLQRPREVAEIYLGDTLEASLQSPTDTHPSSAQGINVPGFSGKNQSTQQSDRRRGRGTGREERCERPFSFLSTKFIEHLLWNPPLCMQIQNQTHPSGGSLLGSLNLTAFIPISCPPCSCGVSLGCSME